MSTSMIRNTCLVLTMASPVGPKRGASLDDPD
jgi:hypothetical protein